MTKDFPQHKVLKYYYDNKLISEIYEFNNNQIAGTLLITEDGELYFDQRFGDVVNMNFEYLRTGNHVYSNSWANQEQIENMIEYQPYDLDELWAEGTGMYSKELWRLVLRDIRTYKLAIIEEKINYKEYE